MSRLIDLSGRVFGNLLVIERAEDYIQENGRHRIMWLCRCSCGRSEDFPVHIDSLKNENNDHSCRICLSERRSGEQIEDLTGMIFGHLEVIGISDDRYIQSDGKRRVIWMCRCDCGQSDDFPVRATRLKSGRTTFCKTCGRQKRSSQHLADLTGEIFGWLRVIKLEKIVKKTGAIWLCYCDPNLGGCGNITSSSTNQLNTGASTSCGCRKESLIATELKNYFSKNYNAKAEYEMMINPKTGYWLYGDIYVPDNIYIEVHGEQHYRFNKFFHRSQSDFEDQQYRDSIKKEFAESNGVYIEIDLRTIKTTEEALAYIGEYILL